MNSERIIYLVHQNQTAGLSVEEQAEFDRLLQGEPEGSLIREELEKMMATTATGQQTNTAVWRQLAQQILQADNPQEAPYQAIAKNNPLRFLRSGWLRYAALIILVLGMGAYIWNNYRKNEEPLISGNKQLPQDIAPGGNRAILTLADGSRIVLDNAATGDLANQGATKILKLDAGTLTYQSDQKNGDSDDKSYNTISTPRGGQYQVVLPDGSKVWLNASSSVTFRTNFLKDRKIEATGEVYFEIAPAKNAPFRVINKGASVEVLGTTFNLNAYEDEPTIKTTLINGSIVVKAANAQQQLQPGEQALTGPDASTGIKVQDADLRSETAWKNRIFVFDEVRIQTVMRQLARWYDIDVVYRRQINERFVATMSMDMPLSKTLELLKTTNLVKFSVQGKTVIVE